MEANTTDQTENVWRRDLASVGSQLTPWLVDIDGVPFISPDAPLTLSSLYGKLMSVGYARGFTA